MSARRQSAASAWSRLGASPSPAPRRWRGVRGDRIRRARRGQAVDEVHGGVVKRDARGEPRALRRRRCAATRERGADARGALIARASRRRASNHATIWRATFFDLAVASISGRDAAVRRTNDVFEHRIHRGIRRRRARVGIFGDVGRQERGDIVERVRELSRHLHRFAATARRPAVARRAEIHRATQRFGIASQAPHVAPARAAAGRGPRRRLLHRRPRLWAAPRASRVIQMVQSAPFRVVGFLR